MALVGKAQICGQPSEALLAIGYATQRGTCTQAHAVAGNRVPRRCAKDTAEMVGGASQLRQRALRVRRQDLAHAIGNSAPRTRARRSASRDPSRFDLLECQRAQRDRSLEQIVGVRAAAGAAQQLPMLEVDPRRGGQWRARQHRIPAPYRGNQFRIDEQRRAVVAVIVWMVVALLFSGVHAVGERRIEDALHAVATAHKAAAAHEHQGMSARLLVRETATASMPAGNVADLDARLVVQRRRAQHARHESLRRARISKPAGGGSCEARCRCAAVESARQLTRQTGEHEMACIRKEILIDASPEDVWAAVRDWGALHERLVPGFVTDTRLDGDDRIVTFFNGTVLRELLVDLDDEARRLAWSIVEGPYTHHNASAQVFSEGDGASRFVWTADLLPNDLADRTAEFMLQGTNVVKQTLEAQAVRG